MSCFLEYFIIHQYPYISEKIERQQIDYGLARIHSHRHISRCIIYADWYADLIGIDKNSIDRLRLYFAISFHDIGRKGELEDVWEGESKNIYLEYLKSVKIDSQIVNDTNELVIKDDSFLWDIIHDVDCLDIMRSGTGRGGIMGFNRDYLTLFKNDLSKQEKIITNAWRLINMTDDIEYDNVDCLKNIYFNHKDAINI